MLINNPKEAHAYVVSIVRSQPLFKLPRNEALLHMLRIVESFFAEATLGNLSWNKHYTGMREMQDILRFVTYWIYTFTQEGGKLVKTTARHMKAIEEVVSVAGPYSKIYDFLGAVERGHATMTVDNDSRVIAFEYADETTGKLFGVKWLNKGQALYGSHSQFAIELLDNMHAAVSELNNSVRSEQRGAFTYKRSPTVLNAFQKVAANFVSTQFSLPSDWLLGDYTLGDFRLFWIHVLKLSLIHSFALMHHIQSKGAASYDNTVYQESRSNFLKHIAMHSGLSQAIIDKMLLHLSYDVSLPHTDIMFQPFFQVDESIIFSPTVIMGSNAERNLIALLNRKQNKSYSVIKNKKEDIMISELADMLASNGYYHAPKIKLTENHQLITDIDLLVMDRKNAVIVMQLKWLNGADSTIEVLNNDEEFENGIRQTKEAIGFLKRTPDFLKSLFGVTPSIICGVVVSKVGLPSPFLKREGVVFVETSALLDGIKSVPGNIEGLYDFLKQTQEQYDLSNYALDFTEERIGEYSFRLPAVRAIRSDQGGAVVTGEPS